MAPQVLYCTKITEKTQKWRSFHQKTLAQKIPGAASAQFRINQEWCHQIENHWTTELALIAMSFIYPPVLGTEDLP
jgi:hypothetical protein